MSTTPVNRRRRVPYSPGLPPDKAKYRPPMWESKQYGEPFGRFNREDAPSGAAAQLREMGQDGGGARRGGGDDDAWRRMRAAAARVRQQHRREGGAVLDAFVAVDRSRSGKCSPAQFKAAWNVLGVGLTDDECAAIFTRVGHDARGHMPYQIFVKALTLGDGRVMGKEEIRKGPFTDANDANFLGKVIYPQCRRGVYPPSDWMPHAAAAAKRSATPPSAALDLDFVMGFPGRDNLANALCVTPHGDVVYYLAALGVVYNRATHTQRFFTGHDDDVRCIAQHPDGITFATGQDGHRPYACVWSAGDPIRPHCRELARLQDPEGYMRSFIAVAFSPDGNVLITVGSDDKHTVSMWNWRGAKGAPPVASIPGIQAAVPAVWGVAWNPFVNASPNAGGGEFVTYGEKHVKVWRKAEGAWKGKVLSFDTAPAFSAHSAVFLPSVRKAAAGSRARSARQRTGAASDGDGDGGGGRILVGCADGKLALFDLGTRRLVRLITGAHKDLGDAPSVRHPGRPNTKGVRALLLIKDEGLVVSAGADGRILTWRLTPGGDDITDRPEEEIVLESPYGPDAPPPRIRSLALATSGDGGGVEKGGIPSSASGSRRFFVGTAMCDLWEVSAKRARIVIGGSSGSLNDVAWNPRAPSVCATVGSDGNVKVWDADRRAQLAVTNVATAACGGGRVVAFSRDGRLLAAGVGDGRVVVMDARSLARVAEAQAGGGGLANDGGVDSVPGTRVCAIAFSPDSTMLAAAAADRYVRVFANVNGRFSPVAKCAGHSTTVVSLDWSEDNRLLRSTCANLEMLHWSMPDGKPASGDVRDVRWCTHNSLVGFPVMGLWEEGKAAPSDLNTVDRTHGERHVATGDDDGYVRLLNYPCVMRNAPARKYGGHSSHVASVRFSACDKWLASTGSKDRALMLWRTSGMDRPTGMPNVAAPWEKGAQGKARKPSARRPSPIG